jgi:magnesium chelatase family protein
MGNVATILSVAPIGFEGSLIEVESDIKNGLPSLQIVGLGNKAIDEAKERVRSAVTNSLLDFPAKKIIVNLAPAELPKDGSHYDLAIALSILTSSGQLRPREAANAVFLGELALDGSIRSIKGILSMVETARLHEIKTVYVPTKNAAQASLIDDMTIIPVASLKELYLHLKQEVRLSAYESQEVGEMSSESYEVVLDDILGQEQAKRALVIAAAGRHNILFTGSPGAGKTMLAKTLLSLLPPLAKGEQIAVTKLHSLAGETTETIVEKRPFRSPHHTSSRIALIGGGTKPRPGEISLAHRGVLFLDEIPEYSRATLESLRQPLEDKQISISRANGHVTYPADFMMVATMNPCPCGYYGDASRECTCSINQINAYQQRLSGPMLDRIDMVVSVPRTATTDLLQINSSSKKHHLLALETLEKAHSAQASRYKSSDKHNANLSSKDIKQRLAIDDSARQLLESACDRLQLSARSYFKIIKVAQTIADLEASDSIQKQHVAEALQYRLVTS